MMVRKAATQIKTQIKKHKNKHELIQNGLSSKRKIASERRIKSEASTETKLQKTIESASRELLFFPRYHNYSIKRVLH